MRWSQLVRSFSALLVLCLLTTAPGWRSVTPVVQAAEPQQTTPTTLPPVLESEPNDDVYPDSDGALVDQANRVGPAPLTPHDFYWRQTITGRISSSDDVDWYKLFVPPATTVRVLLENPPADYDLTLSTIPRRLSAPDQDAGLGDDLPPGEEGLSDILDIGGSIAAIGGSIAAIGGSIAAIGGSIAAIGGSIAAIGGSIAAISANTGTQSEKIETFLWQTGGYYLTVSGSNGAFSSQPYTLILEVQESGLNLPPPAPEVRLNLNPPNAAQIETLYIINTQRLEQLYGSSTALTEVISSVNTLATLRPGKGYVINLNQLTPLVGNSETVRQIYERWQQNQANPLEANRVARLVDNVIKAATLRNPSGQNPGLQFGAGGLTNQPPFPNVKNIVLVGGDAAIPFFRLPDLTSIANEADYAAYLKKIAPGSNIIGPDSPLGSALRYRTILSDNPYGTVKPLRALDYPLFIPRIAVGRLVERPEEIAAYLLPLATGRVPAIIDLRNPSSSGGKAFISGYDFLIDQADTISQTLRTFGMTGALSITGLINNNWTVANLDSAWLPSLTRQSPAVGYVLRSEFGLQSVNAHFDHWQVIPAAAQQQGLLAQSIYAPNVDAAYRPIYSYFTNRLGYSVGCHSGYNVIDEAIEASAPDQTTYRTDFPQAIMKQGGSWIGNTGYGYGSLDSVDYSERIALLFTEDLGRDVKDPNSGAYIGQSIGQAFVHAKLRYIRNATSISAYDIKALQVMTFYGLPFIRVLAPNPQSPPPEDRFTPSQRIAPIPPSTGLLTRQITFTLDFDDEAVSRTGSTLLALDFDDRDGDGETVEVEDNFLEDNIEEGFLRPFQANQVGLPVLPQFAYDITAVSDIDDATVLEVQDVRLIGGIYGERTNFDPQFTQVVTETDRVLSQTPLEPTFEAGAGIWFPDKFYGHTTVGEQDDLRDQLVVSAAQFRVVTDGKTGTMRPYNQLVFEVRYIDPLAEGSDIYEADADPPLIESVEIIPVSTNGLAQSISSQVIVEVSDEIYTDDPDDTGVALVDLIYIADGRNWQRVFLQFDQASATWRATIPVPAENARAIVSATDQAGNTAFFTAKGSFQPAAARDYIYLPLVYRR